MSINSFFEKFIQQVELDVANNSQSLLFANHDIIMGIYF